MKIKEQVREYAYGIGADMCGFAGVERFGESPEGKHPTEILPGCRTVIVVGVGLLDGVIQTNFRAFEDGRRDLKGIYGTYGYAMLPNFELTYICYAIARQIERKTESIATPCSTGPMTNGVQLSIRHSAVAAGLGELGWMGLVLTPKYGARNRFGVILTTLELEQDPLYEGRKLCGGEKCGICTKICPTGALSGHDSDKSYNFTIDGKRTEYSVLDWNKCQMGTLGLTKELGGREDYITTREPTAEDIYKAQESMPISQSGLQHVDSWHCGKCQSYCPAGKWGEHFKKTGLSNGPNLT